VFGKRLRELRKKMKLSQEELAEKLGLSDRTVVANYETQRRGKKNPGFEMLNKLADFFNVSTDYLLGRTSIKNPPEDSKTNIAYAEVNKEENLDWQKVAEIAGKYKSKK
jgi:transcriptional regulator with XRE-family HTH domain